MIHGPVQDDCSLGLLPFTLNKIDEMAGEAGMESIVNGGTIEWEIKYSIRPSERFVHNLTAVDRSQGRLLHFDWCDGTASTLDKFPLLYDINCVNMNPNWREHGRVSDNHLTATCCSIKPQLLYKATLQANLPDMEDYFVALKLVLRAQNLVSSFGSEFDFNTSAMLVKPDHLSPRVFLPHNVLRANAKRPLLDDYYSQKTKTPTDES